MVMLGLEERVERRNFMEGEPGKVARDIDFSVLLHSERKCWKCWKC